MIDMNISREEYETLVSTKMLLIQANETIDNQLRIIEDLSYILKNLTAEAEDK